jgi:hypothetical protein
MVRPIVRGKARCRPEVTALHINLRRSDIGASGEHSLRSIEAPHPRCFCVNAVDKGLSVRIGVNAVDKGVICDEMALLRAAEASRLAGGMQTGRAADRAEGKSGTWPNRNGRRRVCKDESATFTDDPSTYWVNPIRKGTREQLVEGAVEVQLAENFD